MKIEIKNRWNGRIICSGEFENQKECIVDAVGRGADLGDADLGGANLAKANLMEANLNEANLRRVTFRRANLTRARNLTLDQISKVKTLYQAKLDPKLHVQIKEEYPHLLDNPKAR